MSNKRYISIILTAAIGVILSCMLLNRGTTPSALILLAVSVSVLVFSITRYINEGTEIKAANDHKMRTDRIYLRQKNGQFFADTDTHVATGAAVAASAAVAGAVATKPEQFFGSMDHEASKMESGSTSEAISTGNSSVNDDFDDDDDYFDDDDHSLLARTGLALHNSVVSPYIDQPIHFLQDPPFIDKYGLPSELPDMGDGLGTDSINEIFSDSFDDHNFEIDDNSGIDDNLGLDDHSGFDDDFGFDDNFGFDDH